MRPLLERGSAGLLGAAWLWLAVLVVAAGAGRSVSRPAFEAAGLAFGASLMLHAASLSLSLSLSLSKGRCRISWSAVAIAAIAAVAGYGWSVALGPLSDDYLLREWARSGEWFPDAWPYTRPLPLAIWQVLGGMGDWSAIHAFSVAVHAANSGMVAAIAGGWSGPLSGAAAGLLFALFPASAEPVAWAAGVFDVVATSTALAAVLVWQHVPSQRRRRVFIVVLCLLGLASKESAIVIPGLLVLVAMATTGGGARLRDHVPTLLTASGVVAGMVALRAVASPAVAGHLAALPAGRRALKDLLVEPFAGVVMPLRGETDAVVPSLLALATLVLVAIALLPSLTTRQRTAAADRTGPVFFAGFVWVLIGALPLLATLHVAPTLEGSRYLYLSVVGLALAVSAAFGTGSRPATAVAGIALVLVLAVYVWRLQDERAIWQGAAATRDAVLAEAQRAIDAGACASVTVADPPDAVDGAFVFRNGLDVALRGLRVAAAGPPCVLRWDAATRRLIAVGRSE
ncbi:MAG: hypothetical protein AB7H93_12550 [Vicinamibacterales bacterium]